MAEKFTFLIKSGTQVKDASELSLCKEYAAKNNLKIQQVLFTCYADNYTEAEKIFKDFSNPSKLLCFSTRTYV
jgi:hypothetical protein